MGEPLLDELKRYIGWCPEDEDALRSLHPRAQPEFERIATVFYDRILGHQGARTALEGGESQVGRLRVTLVAWMDRLLSGPWDQDYFELRCRIGRVHVRIALPQHYMFGAMNVLRIEIHRLVDREFGPHASRVREAVNKALDLELAIMLHTYREDLLAQQARIERLSAFGQVVGSIGHELRNPLSVIETSLYLLQGRLPDDERVQKHVGRIGEQIGIANGIITNLLDIIRDRPISRDAVQLETVLASAARAVPLPEGVTLTMDGLQALPSVAGDPLALRQVFLNLLENAVHATRAGGAVRVVGEVEPVGGVPMVSVAVEDEGPGLDPEVRRRLFEPLVTTKAKGIGLGLALVKRMVERHGGTVASEPREAGARFVVRLPVEST